MSEPKYRCEGCGEVNLPDRDMAYDEVRDKYIHLAYGEWPTDEREIKTIAGYGYILCGPVRKVEDKEG